MNRNSLISTRLRHVKLSNVLVFFFNGFVALGFNSSYVIHGPNSMNYTFMGQENLKKMGLHSTGSPLVMSATMIVVGFLNKYINCIERSPTFIQTINLGHPHVYVLTFRAQIIEYFCFNATRPPSTGQTSKENKERLH